MAKAKRPQYTSKGQRKNSKLKAAAPKPQVGNNNNTLREAFMNAKLSESVQYSYLGSAIIRAASKEVKRSADAVRGWSANLSFRTFKALQNQGILS